MTGKDEVTPPASNSLSAMLEQGKTIEDVQKGLTEVHKVPVRDVEKPVDRVAVEKVVETVKVKSSTIKFNRGDVVMDTEKDVKVVVTKVGIGFSPKGTPFYRVVEKRTGESWIQKETMLKTIR